MLDRGGGVKELTTRGKREGGRKGRGGVGKGGIIIGWIASTHLITTSFYSILSTSGSFCFFLGLDLYVSQGVGSSGGGSCFRY